jgi:hypothetical protein
LLEKYAEEVVKIHGEGYDWQNTPIDTQAMYANGGGKPMDDEMLSVS